ncbi:MULTISPECIES: glycine betaine/L-proline ABC transporter ATP-binding protein [Mediterranea]|uniref:quaternary amine ABC transporter ATP-binding protein n=1 Tax=Mediterranea TaxID=1926659 RepID=UPI002013742D|nr:MULTISPECIES: glycine betaine/L-proline ABC transporter ATP-binding protein [Mediterranea]MCL1607272.1 glycine betaine/L-proline ABC transporter ATP-binding protein [Mediterranea sp. ET5]MDM8121590.1 glycine betaine/L-proline ABC transporter ATP-binding protein [Mediterranea massiliensis]MDM8199095.1 glycine betaine/L-proline ABC transporter ATP-binding protein [Mediterranea massiliensis]
MNTDKIEIKDLYLVFGHDKQKALKMLRKGKTKQEILKETGCTIAVNNANFTIRQGEIFVIMGLSGSGKSSLLRCLNLLNRPTSGKVIVNGKDIAHMGKEELRHVRRRELAMVFQHFGLLPHRTVLENIAFGLELQGVDKTEREQKARECMSLVKLDGYADMLISELSGGMQQRVGLARALANDPEVLLMDEAFSALDPLIRIEMQDELLALQSKMKKTIVFITHDLEEAIKLGDRIAIMRDGNVEQVGTSEEILTEPANAYIRNFVEKVERRRVITAASIMVDKPVVARLGKEGPEALIRKMKERKLTVLPVVNADGILVGEVRLGDLVELRQKQVKDITPAVREQVHSVLGDTVVDDILPLMTKTNSPIWVVNERREFEGVVPLASLIVEVTGKDKKEINEIIQNAIDL